MNPFNAAAAVNQLTIRVSDLNRKPAWLALIAFVLCFAATPAHADALEEYTAKSLLALNLARFTEWPAEMFKDKRSSINLCVLGDETVQQAFILINNKEANKRMLSVREIKGDGQLGSCHLLFISTDNDNISALVKECQARHVLTIGEDDGFLEHGGMVYLEMTEAKINLNINLKVTQQAGINISSRVLKLATIVNP